MAQSYVRCPKLASAQPKIREDCINGNRATTVRSSLIITVYQIFALTVRVGVQENTVLYLLPVRLLMKVRLEHCLKIEMEAVQTIYCISFRILWVRYSFSQRLGLLDWTLG